MSSQGIIENLKALVVSEEEDARHLFVVCGQPSTQEGFHAAWFKEDPAWFSKWIYLKSSIKALEKLEAAFG